MLISKISYFSKKTILIMLWSILFSFSTIAETDSTGFEYDFAKIKSENTSLQLSFNEFLKLYYNELHNQQYKNDSLFDEVILIQNDIIRMKKEISRIDRNINYLDNIDKKTELKNRKYNITFIVLIGLIYLISIIFIYLNNRALNKRSKGIENLHQKDIEQFELKIELVKKELARMVLENANIFEANVEETKTEFSDKLNAHRESMESRIRGINELLDNRFN